MTPTTDTAYLSVNYTLELCTDLDNNEPPDVIQENANGIKAWLSQLEQNERAEVIASIRAQLADRENGARACRLVGIDAPARAGDDTAWVADGVIAEMIDALASNNGASPDAIASMFDLLALKTPTEHIVYRRLLRERLDLGTVDFDAALGDALGRHSGARQAPLAGPLNLQGALDAYAVLQQRHEDYLMDCVSNPHVKEPEWLELIKEIIACTRLNDNEIDVFLGEVGAPPYLVKRKKTALKNEWRKVRAGQQILGAANVGERPATWPYDIRGGRLVLLTEPRGFDSGIVTATPIADFKASISHEINEEMGSKIFVLDGHAIRSGSFCLDVGAEDFGNDRKLKAILDGASGPLDPVRAGMAKHLGPAIKLLTKQEECKKVKRYKRTGWTDDDCFLIPGRARAGVEIALDEGLVYRVDDDGDLNLGLAALDALLESMGPERTTVPASLVFQAPVARLAEWENERYAIFIAGRTGSLKTSFAKVLMCIYGAKFADDRYIQKWGDGATVNARMNIASSAHDLPLLIDNYKPGTGGGASSFISLIHNIVEGAEKMRLNRNAELRKSRPLMCWPLCTGEDVPDGDPASLARILVMTLEWQRGQPNDALTKAQEFSKHLPAVGNAWIAWLETDEGREAVTRVSAKFFDKRAEWAAVLQEIRKDSVNVLRVASNLATNQLTWEIMCEHPTIGATARKYKEAHAKGLREIVAVTMAETTAEALEATRYIAALKELLATGKAIVFTKMDEVPNMQERDRIIGWGNSGGVYLLPGIARRAAEMLVSDAFNGVSNLALNKQLDALGLIASKRKGQYTMTKRFGQRVERVLHLNHDVFDLDEDDGFANDGERIAAEIPL